MKIFGLSHEQEDEYQVLSASISWEESDRATQRIHFRYGADKSYFISENYHPFLLATVIPAIRRRERRIHIDGAICPWLKDNLLSFMSYMTNWYWYKYDVDKDDAPLVAIEAGSRQPESRKPANTGAFFSGGVDSLYTLRRNRLNIPRGHPGSINDVIFVHGFDMGTRPKRGTEEDYFNYVIDELRDLLDETDLNLIPVFTNLRQLDPYTDCWLDEYMGSAMAAVAHGLSGRLTDVLVSSSYEIPKLHPFASHPVIEPRLSSYELRVHHDGERLSRVERVKMVSQWPTALASLRVCFFGDKTQLNCGKCPKCLRTKLELLCAGKLHEASTLPGGEPTASIIRAGLHLQSDTVQFMSTLRRALQEIGRSDLARAVKFKEWEYCLTYAANWRNLFKSLDRVIFRGLFKRMFRVKDAVGKNQVLAEEHS